MNCPQCGVDVIAGSTFCHKCGARIPRDPAEAAAMTGRLTPPEGHSEILKPAPLPEKDLPQEPRGVMSPAPVRGKDEEVEIWVCRYSAKSMIGTWVLALIVSIAAIVVGVMYSLGWWVAGFLVLLWGGLQLRLWYLQLNNRYRLTSQRLINESGILSRTVNRIELLDINDLQMTRSLVERMVGTGTIKMITGDVTDEDFRIPGIDQVEERFNELEKALRAEKRRREIKIDGGGDGFSGFGD